ncbi:MAG: hypothetical protein WCP93_01260 [Candidatus Berkelbacteria bacterium]
MSELKWDKAVDWLLVFLLLVGFSLQLYLVYFGYQTYHYLVPPGSDAISHYNIIRRIIDTGNVDFMAYPPGFHLLVIFFSKITTVKIFDILTYWTPVLVVLPALSMYFLLRQLFDNKVSVLTSLTFLLASSYPIYSFIDGNYPDILAYGVFAVLLFAFLIRYFKNNKWLDLILACVFLILIALTHHLTFVGIVAILGIFAFIQLVVAHMEHRLKIKLISWQCLMGCIVALLVGLSLYFAFRFYGPTILKFADGFFANSPSNQNNYLNQSVDWSNYALFAGNTIWYVGLIGLLFLIVTTFNKGYEIKTKQLVLVWFAFFFVMSRFAASALPARFARELAPVLVVAIGFLFNYIFNLNALRLHRYKLIFGYALVAFMIVTSSALFTGPAKIPDSFNLMIWFWPKDQQDLDYINSHVSTRYGVLYNPFANLYLPIKASSNFTSLNLSEDQLAITEAHMADQGSHYHPYLDMNTKALKALSGYDKMIFDLSNSNRYKYIFVGVKPPSNPDPKVYTGYTNFEPYNEVLEDLGRNGVLVKKFEDGSRLIKMF